MGKMAVIGDIHGNRQALKAALADIKARGCQRTVCLGDMIAKGSFGDECVTMVKENCHVALRGNCEDYYTNDHLPNPITEKERARILARRAEISEENQRYILSLPFCYEAFVSGRLLRVFHAGPDTVYDYIHTMPGATLEERKRMFRGGSLTVSQSMADIVIYGHIHSPMMMKMMNRTLICAGSVGNNLDLIRDAALDGNTLNTTCVNYVLIEGELDDQALSPLSISFVQAPYDVQRELSDSRCNNPDYPALQMELGQGLYRNMAAVAKALDAKK